MEEIKTTAPDKTCWFCFNSLSGDAPDGTEVLVCFDCAGHTNTMVIVDEEETCENFKGN